MKHLLYFSNELLWYTWIKVQTVKLQVYIFLTTLEVSDKLQSEYVLKAKFWRNCFIEITIFLSMLKTFKNSILVEPILSDISNGLFVIESAKIPIIWFYRTNYINVIILWNFRWWVLFESNAGLKVFKSSPLICEIFCLCCISLLLCLLCLKCFKM